LNFQKIDADMDGGMDLEKLEAALKEGNVGTVVVTMGTTGIGSVDDLKSILALKEKYDFRIHIDAAYGGYFRLASNLYENTEANYTLIQKAESIVIDPHKHGLQPYGCGCILFKNPEVGRYYKHDSPYTYFSSAELHLGEISLECSRAGAAAVGLWATQQLFPLTHGGDFAKRIEASRDAALNLYGKIQADDRFIPLLAPQTDIVTWAVKAKTISEISQISRSVFEKAANQNVHLALFNYPVRLLQGHWKGIEKDQEYVTCLRSCLMKPEHKDWIDRIWEILKGINV